MTAVILSSSSRSGCVATVSHTVPGYSRERTPITKPLSVSPVRSVRTDGMSATVSATPRSSTRSKALVNRLAS